MIYDLSFIFLNNIYYLLNIFYLQLVLVEVIPL